MKDFDAIVIGAGPAGATTALLLARRGLSVAVLEKAAFPRRKVCGEYISATTWPLLRALGVADALSTRTGPGVDRVGFFARDHAIEAPMPAPQVGDAWGRAVRRDALDQLLLERARRAGATVMQPHEALAWRRDGRWHVVDEALRAPVLVAAHGSWERGAMPTQARHAPPRDGDLLGFKAHFRNARLPRGLMPLVLFPGGYGGMVESGEGLTSFSCCIRRDALADVRRARRGKRAGEAVIDHVAVSCRGVREALHGATLESAWLSAGPIRPGIRARAARGVFSVGNAAGEAHPLVAEGISMAIQSAWLLDRCLAATHSPEAAARAYSAGWRRNFAARLHASAAFATLATSRPTHAAMIAVLARAPAMLRWGAWWSGKASDLHPMEAWR